jgi:hypothetical protein
LVGRVLKSRIGKKIEDVLRDQFGFRRGGCINDSVGMLRTMSVQTSDIDGELYACFIDWQKDYGCVNCTKLVLILKRNGVDLRERRLINNVYMAQTVKVHLEQGETRSVKNGGVRKGYCVSSIFFKVYSEYLTKEALEGF